MGDVRVLVIDDDGANRAALASVLGAGGWQVELAGTLPEALDRLRHGPWHLVLASSSVSRLEGPLFELLKDLEESSESPMRVLFLVPALEGRGIQEQLEHLKLPYVNKPIQLHEFLEQVSDLLLGAGVIHQPLRRVRELAAMSAAAAVAPPETAEKRHGMFSSREGYNDYTEEELREFEEEEKRRQKEQAEAEPERS